MIQIQMKINLSNLVQKILSIIQIKHTSNKDYYDENDNGKFILFVNNNEMNTDIIMEQLKYDIDSNENKLIKFGVEDFKYYPNKAYE